MSLTDFAIIIGLAIGAACALALMTITLARQGVLGLLLRGKPFDWERPL